MWTGRLHKKLIVTTALALIITAAALEIFAVQAATPKWNIQIIDRGNVDPSSSITLDSKGNPHIAYSETTYFSNGSSQSYPLMYASIAGKNWTTQSIDNYGEYPSLVFDSSDFPHISYARYAYPAGSIGGSINLNYASWNGSAWNIQSIESFTFSSPFYPTYSSLALDLSGNPHITYILDSYGASKSLKYASWNGSAWNIQTLDQGIYSDQYPTLVLDSKNNPHITYGVNYQDKLYDMTHENHGLNYAAWDGAEWNIQIIAKPAGGCSLVLDKNDKPHVSYVSSQGLTYASLNGSNWDVQTIAEGVWGDTSLSFDSAGNPFICYNQNDFLKYAFWNGTNWAIGVIDENENALGDYGLPAVVLDSHGNPHVSYSNLSGGYIGHGNFMLKQNYAYAEINPVPKTDRSISVWSIAGIIVALAVIALVGVLILRVTHGKSKKSLSPL
jgi:hypothetical protein